MTNGDLPIDLINTFYETSDETPPEVALHRAIIMQQLVDAGSNSRLPYMRKHKRDAIR